MYLILQETAQQGGQAEPRRTMTAFLSSKTLGCLTSSMEKREDGMGVTFPSMFPDIEPSHSPRAGAAGSHAAGAHALSRPMFDSCESPFDVNDVVFGGSGGVNGRLFADAADPTALPLRSAFDGSIKRGDSAVTASLTAQPGRVIQSGEGHGGVTSGMIPRVDGRYLGSLVSGGGVGQVGARVVAANEFASALGGISLQSLPAQRAGWSIQSKLESSGYEGPGRYGLAAADEDGSSSDEDDTPLLSSANISHPLKVCS